MKLYENNSDLIGGVIENALSYATSIDTAADANIISSSNNDAMN